VSLPRISHRLAALGALLFLGALAADAATLKLAPLFTDHAVLQRDQPLPVWGRAAPGATVRVQHGTSEQATTAGPDGRWLVTLPARPAQAQPADLLVRSGEEAVTCRDVRVGDVWICAGQSNIDWPVELTAEAATACAAASGSGVSHFRVAHQPSDTPLDSEATVGRWENATAETVGHFSAVGYFFGEELARLAGVPIGLVTVAWGGTPIESWLSLPSLQASRAWSGFSARWTEALREFPARQLAYPELDRAWRAADEAARRTGQPNPLPWPQPPVGPGTAYAPAALFHGMVQPLAPFPARGVVWYQGESNVGRADEYAELLAALIGDWRRDFARSDLPFVVVQLPNFADKDPAGSAWAELRAAQAVAVRATTDALLVPAIDLGDADDIHPRAKRALGQRLARATAAAWLGRTDLPQAPVVRSVRSEGGRVVVEFETASALHAVPADAGGGFELAGVDGKFFPAEAQITANRVELTCAAVAAPRTVRYAWANQPSGLVHNEVGAAAPFFLPVEP
jgi:sialate O-acetylesterase